MASGTCRAAIQNPKYLLRERLFFPFAWFWAWFDELPGGDKCFCFDFPWVAWQVFHPVTNWVFWKMGDVCEYWDWCEGIEDPAGCVECEKGEERQRRNFLRRCNEAYAAVQADPEVREEELAEQKLWDATLMDELEEEE